MAKGKTTSEENITSGRNPDGTFANGNQISVGNNGGRTPFFEDAEILENKIIEYFTWIEGEYEIHTKTTTITTGKGDASTTTTETEPVKIWIRYPEPPSITGIAIFLGFESRKSMYDYAAKTEFSYSIKRALLKIENNYEKGLWGDKVAGVVFALKNMDWVDKQGIDHTTNGKEITSAFQSEREEKDYREFVENKYKQK